MLWATCGSDPEVLSVQLAFLCQHRVEDMDGHKTSFAPLSLLPLRSHRTQLQWRKTVSAAYDLVLLFLTEVDRYEEACPQ